MRPLLTLGVVVAPCPDTAGTLRKRAYQRDVTLRPYELIVLDSPKVSHHFHRSLMVGPSRLLPPGTRTNFGSIA